MLSGLKFPLYPIPAERVVRVGTRSIAYYRQNDAPYVVDDKAAPGSNLGQRRLNLRKDKSIKLIRLRKGINNLTALVKSSYKLFVDYNGKVIHYKKTRSLKLKYYKILSWNRYSNGEILLEVQNLHCKIPAPYPPDTLHVGLLHLGVGGYIFYEYNDDEDLINNDRLRKFI